jgi:hypothetical protein
MPEDYSPPSREEILTSLMRYENEARTSRTKRTEIKDEKEIGKGLPESELIITETPYGPHKRQVARVARFGCGCYKPESDIGASCQHLMNRKERCNRIICRDCAQERVCHDCGSRLCEDHLVIVQTARQNTFYFCVNCARKRVGRNTIKAIFRALLAPFMVKEKRSERQF